jgi:hypothetical protein
MNSVVLSGGIFLLMLGGIYFGSLLRNTLPQQHLSKDAQDVVRLGVGLIATMAALVVGLLIASAKNSFDTQSGQVKQITADIILLDTLLSKYGPEAQPIREQIRQVIDPFADRIWREKRSTTNAPFETSANAEEAYLAIQALTPKTDLQRLPAEPCGAGRDRHRASAAVAVRRNRQFVSAGVPWRPCTVARYHLREFQPVRQPQCDGIRRAVAIRSLGVLRDIPHP